MMVIPAIDLMQGKVVRLARGDPGTVRYYEQWGKPADVAMKWKAEGARRLHIIDLDAAFGKGGNISTISEIAGTAGLPVQVGGGIRTIDMAEKLLQLGVRHVILGALAFSNPDAIAQIQRKFGYESVIVALDNRDGKVMVEGWKTETTFTMSQALKKFTQFEVRSFLITSIKQDGTMQGADLDTLRKATEYSDAEIIAAGGIGGLKDLVALKNIGVEGVVVGKALYEDRFTLKEAIETVGND
jgi:phosphoribosylformimino-5-aminoimidazole carboxamide ribotide isomerase